MSKKNKKDNDWGDHWKSQGPGKLSPATKCRIDKLLEQFAASPVEKYTFEPSLSSGERAYIHRHAQRIGWKSASSGVDAERCITITKPKEDTLCTEVLQLKDVSLKYFEELQRMYGIAMEDELEINMARHSRPKPKEGLGVERLGYGPPKVPKAKSRKADSYAKHRQFLPIWKHRENICKIIQNNSVTFVKGDTGCGKTTQVAQYILDEAHQENRPVRIICTVPRRLAAISISERVAVERGENVGSTVGYQIRLEKRLSLTETMLTYCTAGILLRSITSPDSTLLDNLTHIIIDEVHERDRYTDFLMSCLKIMMPKYQNIRLVLMGADLNVDLFTNYFGGACYCPVIHVQGQAYPVETLFLEDVLDILGFKPFGSSSNSVHRQSLRSSHLKDSDVGSDTDWEEFLVEFNSEIINVNFIIESVFVSGDQDSFDTFVDLVMKNVISVDSRHSDPASDVTMLMAVAAAGDFYRVNSLLQMGADVTIRSKGNYKYTAKEWAEQYSHGKIFSMLSSKEEVLVTEKKLKKLNDYLKDLDTEKVDLILAYKLIQKIHNREDKKESILVFLPGYEEIVTLNNIVVADEMEGFADYDFQVHMLHSNIQSGDQKTVFNIPKRGTRKIILSTNIAETSLTIEDIVHVIDSGKVKEKSYDVITGVTQLKSVWISKASSNQRKGRAGRCQAGICYRLYSTHQHAAMEEFPTPEIIRTNLHELCLSSRSFLTSDYSIEYFFSLIPQPPAPIAVQKAVQELISMGALDKDEFLTDLGIHLVDFPVEPRLGKALIYSIVFKCLNPILIIVSALSHKDPFQLPANPELKTQAYQIKRLLSEDCFSDHKALLTLFQKWEKAAEKGKHCEMDFCKQHFASASSLKMIQGIRTQLLSQVKASGFVKGVTDFRNVNSNQNNWTIIKAVLTVMLYPSLCCARKNKQCLSNCNETKIMFHKSTTVHSRKNNWTSDVPFQWVVYDEMTKTGPLSTIRGCTMISTAMVSFLVGNFIAPIIDGRVMKVGEWLQISSLPNILSMVLKFRTWIDNLVVSKLKNPSYIYTEAEAAVVSTIVKILSEEEVNQITVPNTKVQVAQSLLRPFTEYPNLVHISGNRMVVCRRK